MGCDFIGVKTSLGKDRIIVSPDFKIDSRHRTDLMTKGKSFYAVWNEDEKLWSTDINLVVRYIDDVLKEKEKELKEKGYSQIQLNLANSFDTKSWVRFLNYVASLSDNFIPLDSKLTFQNTVTKKSDYVSMRLPYSLEDGDHSAWDRLTSVLYSPEEKRKIEWAIGSIVAGDSSKIQKFVVFYGDAGSGKSTILNIIEKLFRVDEHNSYVASFNAKALGQSNNQFSTSVFKDNPLVAIQQDGDLSHIEDNSILNSIISHETTLINEKNKPSYPMKIRSFLFMATNQPVKITDAKSGIIRRLIDISPSGEKVSRKEYDSLMKTIDYQLGAIAKHCLDIYRSMGINYYDTYRPVDMMYKTDPFYNFVEDRYDLFAEHNGTTLKAAWDSYLMYCDQAKLHRTIPQHLFREELKNYFVDYKERARVDGVQVRKYYSGFLSYKFEMPDLSNGAGKVDSWLKFDTDSSKFDILAANYPAQLTTSEGYPLRAWAYCKTTISNIDTHELHYVKVPQEHIVIDFDIHDSNGAKSFEANLKAASEFPPTYAELSKSGGGIHLHYIYKGDVKELARLYAPEIEIKVFTGNASLRRKLTKCNSLDILEIDSGLPLKEKEKKTNMAVDDKSFKSEGSIAKWIIDAINKKHWGGNASTSQEINLLKSGLDQAYDSGITYNVIDMKDRVEAFAAQSSNQSSRCLQVVKTMHFMSKDYEERRVIKDLKFAPGAKETFFDIEVFPNLLVIVYAVGVDGELNVMVNPSPTEVWDWIFEPSGLLKYKLIGFNNKRYDNHIILGRAQGRDSLYDCYERSQRIIGGEFGGYLAGARDISYTDIYDYSSKKQSLKKFEIELANKGELVHHQELPIAWDKPVPEDRWDEVVGYCKNDVLATIATWKATQQDFIAREILAKWSGLTVNDSTNDHTAAIIFGNDMHPQRQFNYRFMGDVPSEALILDTKSMELHKETGVTKEKLIEAGEYNVFDIYHRPIFPGYTFDQYAKATKSRYREEEVSEGGQVYAEPGLYTNIYLNDIASMHPSSIVAENLFGDEYTKKFADILQLRLYIKHKEFDKARSMFGGIFAEYLTDPDQAKVLSTVLKIPINSVYGLTSQVGNKNNRFRDDRNIDNIVAKRGALFMVNLKNEVQKHGYTVAHIKTDSIKIPIDDSFIIENATPGIVDFVNQYGKLYGYNFELEDIYERLCLVNNAVYIAKYKTPHIDKKTGKEIWWTATGAQFQHPYIFKTLFTHEDLTFADLCETKTVTSPSAMYLDMNEDLPQLDPADAKEFSDLTDCFTGAGTKREEAIRKAMKRYGYFDEEEMRLRYESLKKLDDESHNYVFVGRAGQFCPIKEGYGGGVLYRFKDGKYSAVTGTKGYRWLESEVVKTLDKEKDIDYGYFEELAQAAKDEINKYCDFEWFASDRPNDDRPGRLDITSDQLPF